MEGRSTNGLMRARRPILPGAEGGVSNLIGGTTQARSGAEIDVGTLYSASSRARPIAEGVEVDVADRLP